MKIPSINRQISNNIQIPSSNDPNKYLLVYGCYIRLHLGQKEDLAVASVPILFTVL